MIVKFLAIPFKRRDTIHFLEKEMSTVKRNQDDTESHGSTIRMRLEGETLEFKYRSLNSVYALHKYRNIC